MRREADREGPLEAVLQCLGAAAHPLHLGPDGDDACLHRAVIVADQATIAGARANRAAENDVLVVGLDGDVTALATARLEPLRLLDRATRRRAWDGEGC